MDSKVTLLPILDDNYVFFFGEGPDVCLVDPGDGEQCVAYLLKNNLRPQHILITHHHGDHIDGIRLLKQTFPNVKIHAPLKNKNQIPSVDAWVQDQQSVRIPQGEFEVIELPGHTLGIVGYLNRKSKCLFAGDVLFGLGCGRLFEGSPEVAFNSLAKIAGLEPSTSVYCTHEYTLSNLQFVESLRAQKKLPEHFDFQFFETYKARTLKMRAASLPTVPLSLKAELKVNPFLLCVVAKDLALFTKLRDERNYFRPK